MGASCRIALCRKGTGRRWTVEEAVHKRFRPSRSAVRIEHMFEWAGAAHPAFDRPGPTGPADLQEWLAQLADLDENLSDAERIDQLRVLEELKAGTAAAQ